MRVALFVTCLVDLLRPSIGFAAISRLSLREMPAAEECCGFGGSFSIRFGDISAAIADRKCANVRQAGVDAVVGGELGCLLNIEGRLRRLGDRHTRVLHIAEVLTGDGRRS